MYHTLCISQYHIIYMHNAHSGHNNIILYELYLFYEIFYKITYKSIKFEKLVLYSIYIIYHYTFANLLDIFII